MNNNKLDYVLQLADNALILGQRYAEWCGIGPELEIDLALSNTSLDLFGQADLWLHYAAELSSEETDSDKLAFLRDFNDFKNVQVLELPNGNFADTIIKAFLFDQFNYLLHKKLANCSDDKIAAIAAKSLKEITYHIRYSAQWTLRLGDGTDESHKKMQDALNNIWDFVGGMFHSSEADSWAIEHINAPDLNEMKNEWKSAIEPILKKAKLNLADSDFYHSGGKDGNHTEHLGYILAEMQFMQRAYPNLEW